ncbi:MAG: glycosyltransferase family 4 protein [Ignavibacteriales bacterium]|nr:glycosyltransferase family 4 protein [Ignavibacteriales bacterium]
MERKLKILHICSSLAWGGAEIAAVKLAHSFKDRGHDIYFAAHPRGRIFAELQTLGIYPIPVRLLRNFDPYSSLKLRLIINKHAIDLLHVHMSRDLVHAYLATSMMNNRPRIILQKQVSSKVSKKDLFHRLIYSHVDKIFVLSNFLRENILNTCPVYENIVTVIPGGINTTLYRLDRDDAKNLRAEFGIPANALVIGSVGRIDRAKGFTELVNALACLPDSFKETRLVIVGEATFGEENYNNELHELVNFLGLKERIIFAGYRSDIHNLFSVFDIFALPSYEEAFGYVYIEAMAAGLPVIAADAGGASDIITDGETGFLVTPKNVDSLKDGLIKLLSDHQLRQRFGVNGKKKVYDKFLESDILQKYENEYYSLLK